MSNESNEVDCVWYLIVERMKNFGQLEKLSEIQPPRNWSSSRDGGPRRISLEHIREFEEKEEQKAHAAGGKKQ